MAKNDYEFTYCIRYNEERIVSNLPFRTKEYAVQAARYIVDLMVHEAAGTDKPYDPARFKLHYRPMKSASSRVRTIKRGGPPHPVEAFAPVEAPPTQPAPTAPPAEEHKAPAKARARAKKVKAEA